LFVRKKNGKFLSWTHDEQENDSNKTNIVSINFGSYFTVGSMLPVRLDRNSKRTLRERKRNGGRGI